MVATLTSAGGLVALLDEKDEALKLYALQNLNALADQFWAEIADALGNIEVLFEDTKFKHRQLAALVASKIYYHLGELDDSVAFALGAGDMFDLNAKTEFVETIIAKCIDKYIQQRIDQFEGDMAASPDKALEQVVERMFKRCFDDSQYYQAIGIALEARRLDVVRQAVKAGDSASLLSYIFHCSMHVIQHRGFRNEILSLLVELYSQLGEPDYLAMGQCLVSLNNAKGCADLLNKLVSGSSHNLKLLALQLCFDLEDTATQHFLLEVSSNLQDGPYREKFQKILSGHVTIQLHLEFLHRNNHADLMILKQTKGALESRNSLFHSSITFANALTNAGTTSDQFLRDNLDWLSRANNWSKFSATAALGVIHKGNIEHSMSLLKPYLPQQGVAGSPYSEGGALYALGLMNANHAQPLDYLRKSLKDTTDEVLQHGACLGIGVSGMATGTQEIYDDLKTTLYTDSAVAGEAAGLAMGLIMLGTGNQVAFNEMLQYAHETQHEKIIRGLSLGMALIMYGKENEADSTINTMIADSDALIRYGGIFMVALAYAGTGNNKALRRLLHVAVSDVNDDVRRAAVISIGFLLSNTPSQVPRVVELLSESFNPHVRYGACLALGISCASTNSSEALQLLEPLLKDSVDYVRQGALIAQAMILMQHSAASTFRQSLAKIISDRHEAQLAKFGAVLAQGILDAGGRNCNISLRTRGGTHNSMLSVVGMAVFVQFWYWHPLTLFLSLSLTPTALIALDEELRVPKLQFTSNAKPSMFAYPPPTQEKTQEKVEKVQITLSTTAKAKARAKKKEENAEAMEGVVPTSSVPPTPTTPAGPSGDSTNVGDASSTAKKAQSTPKKTKEPAFETKDNLTRVLPAQEQFISFDACSYQPIKKTTNMAGILIMDNPSPKPDQEFIELSASKPAAAASANESEEPEPNPPEPFVYPFDD